MAKWSKTAMNAGVDLVALEAASGRVLFSLAGWRRHEVAAGGGRDGVWLQPGGGIPRQVACLQGNVEIDTGEGGAGLVRLEPGAVWAPAEDRGAGGKEIVVRRRRRQTGGGGESGMAVVMELAFARPLAAEYAAFLARNFGRLVRLPLEGEAWRALRGLESAMVAGNGVGEVVSRRVFGWLAALHGALEARQVHLRDLLRGRIDHLLPECAAHGYSVKALATHLGCSPVWLAGRLQRAWGRPAGEVLHGLRYRQAWALLNTTSMDVAEAGRRCGFGSASSFVTAFRRACGVTPAQARGRPVPRAWRTPVVRTGSVAHAGEAGEEPATLATGGGGEDDVRVAAAVWSGPYFQFDGGVSDVTYAHPYDLSINTISNSVCWVLTLEGEAVFECGGHSLTLRPGMVLVYPQPLNGRLVTREGRPWRRLWIKVRGEWAVGAMLALGAAHGWVARVPLSSRVVRLTREWVDYWSAHRGEPSVEGSRAAFEWLAEWWRFLCIQKPVMDGNGGARMDEGGEGAGAAEALPDLRRLLSRSFFRRIKTISGYAAQIGYSREHTSRKLRGQWSNGTPAQIVRRNRLAQAALDLRHTRMSVAEVAQRAQFASAGTFIVAFKKRFGQTPLAWRLGRM